MENFTILIVDDVAENLHTLNLLLEDEFDGINVLEALSVKDALVQVMKERVDLILTDVQMPEASGFDLAKYLIEIEETKDIPVMMITGIYQDDKYKKMAFESSKNVVAYIAKPIDSDLLAAKLRVFIDIFNKNKISLEKISKLESKQKVESKVSNMIDNLDNHFEINKDEICDFLNEDESFLDIDEIKSKI